MLCALPMGAQSIIDAATQPARVAQIASRFAPKPGEHLLNCSADPVKPLLGFGFRFRAGYVFRVPMDQFDETRHRWTILTEITPDATGQPVQLIDFLRLPPTPKNKLSGEAGGGYLLGEGHYHAKWALMDEQGRVCRKQWEIDVKLRRSEASARVAMPPNRVAELSLKGLTFAEHHPDPGRPIRLTVLVDAAPLMQRRMVRNKLSANDHVFLISAVSALLERIPTSAVRVVVFNLEHQQELFRREGFTLDSLDDLSQALNALMLGTVDYKILLNRKGHVDFLSSLINQELRSAPSPEAVVFLGPREKFDDKIPPELLDQTRMPGPVFFFMRYATVPRMFSFGSDPCGNIPRADMPEDPQHAGRGGHSGNSPCTSTPMGAPNLDSTFSSDTVSLAVKILKGKTITIQSPGEFARAIEQVERRVASQPQSTASNP